MKEIMNKLSALWQTVNKTQVLRHAVQILSFLLFPGLFLTVFNALRDVATALFTGTFTLTALGGSVVTLAIVFGVTILWGRFFCGYLCSFGALQELFAFAGRRLRHARVSLPEKADKVLKYCKYGVLFAIVLLVWVLQLPVDSSFSPWGVFGALTSGNLTVMGEVIPTVGFGLLLTILTGSFFVERAFCRYLCPLGALFTPLSTGRLFRIRRLKNVCTGCRRCTRDCAMNVAVHDGDFVRSGECIDCMRCLGACPPKALRTTPHPAVAGTASALALCGLIQVGKMAVSEENTATNGAYAENKVVSTEPVSIGAKFADGVYTGQGNGFRGVISVQVTVSGGCITDVTVLSSQDDSDFFLRAKNGVIPAVLNGQSVNVAAVSGATYSSRGILEAVADALQLDASVLPQITDTQRHGKDRRNSSQTQDGSSAFDTNPFSDTTDNNGSQRKGKGHDTEQSDSSRNERRQGGKSRGQGQNGSSGQNQTTSDDSGKIMTIPFQLETQMPETASAESAQSSASADHTYSDGMYTGTGTGYRGAIQVQVNVENGIITEITVLDYSDDRQYFSRAQSSLITAILNAQNVDVSTVSGATFSSNGILEALADALDIDFTNPNVSMEGHRKGRG